MDIGKNIRQARIKQGKSQTFVASQLGRTSGWLSNIERGHRKLAADDVRKIAEVLGVPVEEIFLENPLSETFKKTKDSETEPTSQAYVG